MIWKDYLKSSEIASYSKLADIKSVPPSPPGRNIKDYTIWNFLNVAVGRINEVAALKEF